MISNGGVWIIFFWEKMMIRIVSLSDKQLWNDYVDQHEQGHLFHRFEWKEVIDKAIKHNTYYLIAEKAGKVEGLLPLTHVKSLLFGNNLVSNPFCVYGGILSDNQQIADSLWSHAVDLAKELKVDALELRNFDPLQREEELPTKHLYFTFIKPLSADNDENMKGIPRKQRAMVRKAIKFDLNYDIETSLDNFRFAYETSVRNLGTPIFPKPYFYALQEVFGDHCDVLTVKHKGETISSVMNFYYKNTVYPYYGGGTEKARALAANDFMYWSLMEHAVSKGMTTFDFGRSKAGTGAYNFKKNWGFEPKQLHYQYYLNTMDSIPEINPLNPKYRLFIQAWQKMPLSLARIIGPFFSKHLG